MASYSKNLKKLTEHLSGSEKIYFSCYGAFETEIMGRKSLRNGIFVSTDERIIFYGKKLFGYDLESFPYEKISSIEVSKGLMGKKIKFMMSGNSASMKWIQKGEPVELVNFVRDKMGVKPEKSNEIDIPSQIKKLSALKDDGILTDEEFNLKKTELLSKM